MSGTGCSNRALRIMGREISKAQPGVGLSLRSAKPAIHHLLMCVHCTRRLILNRRYLVSLNCRPCFHCSWGGEFKFDTSTQFRGNYYVSKPANIDPRESMPGFSQRVAFAIHHSFGSGPQLSSFEDAHAKCNSVLPRYFVSIFISRALRARELAYSRWHWLLSWELEMSTA